MNLNNNIKKLAHISLYISRDVGNARIKAARNKLPSNPVKITRVDGDKFYSNNGAQIFLLAGDKIQSDPDPKGKVNLDGGIILYTNNQPAEIKNEILKQAKKYNTFVKNLKNAQNLLPSQVKVIPKFTTNALNRNTEICAERIQKIFQNQNLDFMKDFQKVFIKIYENLVEISIYSQYHNIRYENIFEVNSNNNQEIFTKIKTYFENFQKVDAKISYIQNNYNVKLAYTNIRVPSEISHLLVKLEKVLKTKKYAEYNIYIEPSLYVSDRDYDHIENNIFVSKTEKKIIVQ